ncbi:hypothetical protein [Mycolicibacterium sp. 120270]|uniref:hypothetical protein n=1 Tax=Mycolicibacterium sp. 120270 TaxID=3090600 RepID=UPI00299CE1C7|nr:hypothetical protein [Mycolicibacterium sp. 120270]MDX1887303.1 hypothetical protein [Mycolicibacterium sp. 120270]
MDASGTDALREPDIPLTSAAQLLTISSICPACGYPTLGMGLCAYCRPLTQQAG